MKFAVFYRFALVAQAERADGSGQLSVSGSLQLPAPGADAQARLCVLLPVRNHQHVGQVGDVAGGEAQRLYL